MLSLFPRLNCLLVLYGKSNMKLVYLQSLDFFFPLILNFIQWCVTVKVADYSNVVLTCKCASLHSMGLKNTAHRTWVCLLPTNILHDFWVTFTYPFPEVGNITKNRLRAQSGSAYCLAYYKNGQAQIRWLWQRHWDCQETVWQAWVDLSFWTACRESLPGKA